MNKYICMFALLAISYNSFCNTERVTAYYKYIYIAEEEILNGNYKNAATNYDKAFNINMSPFAADVYNNMLIGINIADNSRVLKMAKLLVSKGIDTCFFRKAIFLSFRSSKEWNLLLLAYPILKEQRERTIDKYLLKKLREIIDEEQELSIAYNNLPQPTFAPSLDSLFKDENWYKERKIRVKINNDLDSIYNELRTLMINNDYLSEEKIGIEMEDTQINFSPDFLIAIQNSFQCSVHPDTSALFIPLINAIHLGKLKSGFAMNYLNVNKKINYLLDYHCYKDTLLAIDYESEQGVSHSAGSMYLLSKKPTIAETDFRTYCHMDKPENIIRKVKYIFQLYCNASNGNICKASKVFYFGPTLGNFSSSMFRNVYEKVIDICHPL